MYRIDQLLALLVLETVSDELPLAHVEQPVQLPPTVLPAVEGCEPAHLLFQFLRFHFTEQFHNGTVISCQTFLI